MKPIWAVCVAVPLVAGAWLVSRGGADGARGHLSILVAVLIMQVPLRRVRGARLLAVVAFAAAMAAFALGVSAASERRVWGWGVAAAGLVAMAIAMFPSVARVFGRRAAAVYLAADALAIACAMLLAPFAIAKGTLELGLAAAAASLLFTAGSCARTRP